MATALLEALSMVHDRLRHRALGWWSRLICRWPWWVLFVAAVGVVVSVTFTARNLEFQSDRNALLSMNLDWNRNFEYWRSSFPGHDDFYVVVDAGNVTADGHHEAIDRAKAMVDELGPALQAMDDVEHAVWSFDPSAFSERTVRLLPMDQFEARLTQVASSQLILENTSPQAMLGATMAAMRNQAHHSSDASQQIRGVKSLTRVIQAMGHVLSNESEQRSRFAVLASHGADDRPPHREYLVSNSGRLLFIRVTPRKQSRTIHALHDAITAIRQQIERVQVRYPHVEAGLTGIDVVEGDEAEAIARDTTIASVVASVLITIMLIVAFHSWRVPLLAMVALLTGIAWTFGFLTLAVGHLQILSVVFAVILLGLGIDFGIHLVARLELVRHRYGDDRQGFSDAMCDSFQSVGPGVITGAMTTAAAFCTTLLTDFRGVAEMGLIAAGGIMLCLVAMFSVFPALLCLFSSSRRHHVPIAQRRFTLFQPSWVMLFVRSPRTTLLIAGAITVVSLLAAGRMKFDYDLLKLQPRGSAGVQWQDRITRDGGQSIWWAVSVVESLQAARDRKTQLQAIETVGRVNGIGLLFPSDEQEKLDRLQAVSRQLAPSLTLALTNPDDTPKYGLIADKPGLMTVLATMRLALQTVMAIDVPITLRHDLDELAATIDRVVRVYGDLEDPTRSARLAQLHLEYTQWRREVAQQVASVLDDSPLTAADFPAELLRPYIATQGPFKGSYAMEIHPKLPPDSTLDGPLNERFLPKFVGDLEKIDAKVTGVIVQIYRSGYLILRSYQMAGLYALTVVFVLVWMDFRSFRAACLCLVPVAMGFAVTFGVMWVFSVSVNPANIIVLPLMFGIGVDSGVHMIHRYRQDPLARPLGLSAGTGKGVTMTSLTTMIGFGSMMFANHRGIASLGFVMTIGIGLTLLACWSVVPAWLEFRANALGTRTQRLQTNEG